MPRIRITPDLEMHYQIDDYTDPWRTPESILLLHGNSERGAVWYGWVPHLARHLRVVRPDMRGYGDSTPMRADYPWTLERIVDDFVALMNGLNIERFHVVGAKIGGTFARRMAARFPEKILTLTIVGAPAPRYEAAGRLQAQKEELQREGIEGWARRTMGARMGSTFPREGVEWFVRLMAGTPLSSTLGFISSVPTTDISADLPLIRCPTLVITTGGSGYGSVEETRTWQERIPDSRLLALPGDSFHVAATEPDRCAMETLAFIRAARR